MRFYLFTITFRAQRQILATAADKFDLDQLDARLREVSSGNNTSPPFQLPGRSGHGTPSPVPEGVIGRGMETDAYNDLVNDGGRPLYAIDILERVSRSWEEYSEILQPWIGRLQPQYAWECGYFERGERWEVLQAQAKRWEVFRNWQSDNRGLNDDASRYLAFVRKLKRANKLGLTEKDYTKWLAQIEANPSYFQGIWEEGQPVREEKRYYCRESACDGRFPDGFPGYVDAVKRRLAQHGFTRQFQLHEDPKQQDRLATWIEYLNFEYWWLDRYTRAIRRRKPERDKAWQELVDTGILKPGETRQSIRTDAHAMQMQAVQDSAHLRLDRAQQNAKRVHTLTQLDPGRVNIPESGRIRMLQAATREIRSAQDSVASIIKRNDLITNFIRGSFPLEEAKKNEAVQAVRCQWVLEQVPLVEAELINFEATQAGSSDGHESERRDSKQQKLNHQQSPLLVGQRLVAPAKEKKGHMQAYAADAGGSPLQGETFKLEQAETSTRSRKRSRAEDEAGNDSGEPSGKRRKTIRPVAADGPACRVLSPATARQSEHIARPTASLQAAGADFHKSGDDRRTLRSQAKVNTRTSVVPSVNPHTLRRSQRIAEREKASKLTQPSKVKMRRRETKKEAKASGLSHRGRRGAAKDSRRGSQVAVQWHVLDI